ncbi:ANTAR domain-containing protein [Streptomyces barringtoniae]|uniref:ANTAR domain-containing protein n=1 Tax=Streptomyces barringtoniae TaxID=2892029 RepID=UPI001E49A3A5|nr:ANTAR domain-containing protein [Streptomyces barringtoniae]MCC5477633.1 ANTAR domain-containing protein [Streptomyces barringtoniae]
MTGEATVTVQPVTEQAVVLRLSGTLDAHGAGVLGRELDLRLRRADERGLRLVLDMSGVRHVSSTAVHTLDLHTRHRAADPVLVTGATPQVHRLLTTTPLPGIRLYPSLEGALAAVSSRRASRNARTWLSPAGDVPGEVFGLRAKARTSGIIGIAQGILIARYSLPGPADAFALLRAASQHHNVPLRVVASAVVAAPPPLTEREWFPGRRHAPPPGLGLPQADAVDPRDRRQVLRAALYAAVTLADADAAEIHLTDSVQDEALVLEAHHGLDAAYRDCLALVAGPPAVCALARIAGRPVTVADVAANPELAGHPVGRAALAVGSRALHAVPMVTDAGDCNGVISLHRVDPGAWLHPGQEADLDVMAHGLAMWRSWYGRTVVQDALEYLHLQAAGGG